MKQIILFLFSISFLPSTLFAQIKVEEKYIIKYLGFPPLSVNNKNYYRGDTLRITDKIQFFKNKSIILYHINSARTFPVSKKSFKKGESLEAFLKRTNRKADGTPLATGWRGSQSDK